VTGSVPGEPIPWRNRQGAPVHTSGVVPFDPARDQIRVQIGMRHQPPGGALGDGLECLLGVDPRRQINDDLPCFNSLLEATGREIVTPVQIAVQGG
jgi:uncharacterized membrane protein